MRIPRPEAPRRPAGGPDIARVGTTSAIGRWPLCDDRDELSAVRRSPSLERNPKAKLGPGRIGTLQPHAPTEAFGDLPADVQPHPRAADVACQRLIHLVEALEDPVVLHRWDAGSTISNRDACAVSVLGHGHGHNP